MNDFSFYFGLGWEHIISWAALDHLLFIAALAAIYMLKDWKQVLILVTAFTAGHTITLILSSKEFIPLDEELIEFLIPCTIAITAIFNLFQRSFTPRAIRINYFLALFFGLIHGLAFASLLRMILAKEQSFPLAMFSFSVGLETGQVLVVLSVLLLCQLFIQLLRIDRRHWVIFVSAAVFALSLEMAAKRWPWRDKSDSETAHETTARRLQASPIPSAIFYETTIVVANPGIHNHNDKCNNENSYSFRHRSISVPDFFFAKCPEQSRLQPWQQV